VLDRLNRQLAGTKGKGGFASGNVISQVPRAFQDVPLNSSLATDPAVGIRYAEGRVQTNREYG
jgi:hypothetical protein